MLARLDGALTMSKRHSGRGSKPRITALGTKTANKTVQAAVSPCWLLDHNHDSACGICHPCSVDPFKHASARVGAGVQENASKSDAVPPNQGGKYVGFGSGAPSPSRSRPGSAGSADITQTVTRQFGQLSTAAGTGIASTSESPHISASQHVLD